MAVVAAPALLRAQDDGAQRRASAQGQFARAETLRTALEAKPERQRSLQEYKDLITAYRRVYLITPHATEVPQALMLVGDFYRRMGEQFEALYFEDAVEAYEFLVHEYPTSKHRDEALLAIAEIQRKNLNEPNLAEENYKQFLDRYPNSPLAGQASKALAEMKVAEQAAVRKAPAQAQANAPLPTGPTLAAPSAQTEKITNLSSVTRTPVTREQVAGSSHVHIWNTDTYTRIIIDLGGKAMYQAARIANPDRIYFDIENAKLSSELLHEGIQVPAGGYLKTMRVAQNRGDVLRVVLEVTQVKDYSAFELSDPDRLVVDMYGPNAQAGKTDTASAAPTKAPLPQAAAPAPATAANSPAAAAAPAAQVPSPFAPKMALPAQPTSVSAATPTAKSKAPTATVADAATASAASTATVAGNASDASVPRENLKKAAAEMKPAALPEPTQDGSRSLTRALGLKIGRIVIDPGHGGHDTGTIGPTGLMEKDLCLDLALRLGKLIQERLPSAEVVYTRDDDSFVPLEQRTALANQAKADLFVSIHANSSDDHHVSGIETYYLNFNASPEAMQVATRENAPGQLSVHDLDDLVNKIARNEKIEESRDLAKYVQGSLSKRGATNPMEHDRGVRQAPFVVLIGANMPSVLTEVSFLSNPADEQRLKKPESRQQIAEGLYRGIQSYLQSTNSLSSDLAPQPERSASVVR